MSSGAPLEMGKRGSGSSAREKLGAGLGWLGCCGAKIGERAGEDSDEEEMAGPGSPSSPQSPNQPKSEEGLKNAEKEARKRDKQITRQLKQEGIETERAINLLILGTGESGKSTILKQIKVLHSDKGASFSTEERDRSKYEIFNNIRIAMTTLIIGMEKYELEFATEGCTDLAQKLLERILPESVAALTHIPVSLQPNRQRNSITPESKSTPQTEYTGSKITNPSPAGVMQFTFSEEDFDMIRELWNDEGIQECYVKHVSDMPLPAPTKYLLDRLPDIRHPDYVPTDDDIVRCRVPTSGIQQFDVDIRYHGERAQFHMYDVGGQRGERRKWIQVFDRVTAIQYVVDSASFDMQLREDESKNRLLDAIEMFDDVWNNKFLRDVDSIVFLNKIDLLNEKVLLGGSFERFLQSVPADHKLYPFLEKNSYELFQPSRVDYDSFVTSYKTIQEKTLKSSLWYSLTHNSRPQRAPSMKLRKKKEQSQDQDGIAAEVAPKSEHNGKSFSRAFSRDELTPLVDQKAQRPGRKDRGHAKTSVSSGDGQGYTRALNRTLSVEEPDSEPLNTGSNGDSIAKSPIENGGLEENQNNLLQVHQPDARPSTPTSTTAPHVQIQEPTSHSGDAPPKGADRMRRATILKAVKSNSAGTESGIGLEREPLLIKVPERNSREGGPEQGPDQEVKVEIESAASSPDGCSLVSSPSSPVLSSHSTATPEPLLRNPLHDISSPSKTISAKEASSTPVTPVPQRLSGIGVAARSSTVTPRPPRKSFFPFVLPGMGANAQCTLLEEHGIHPEAVKIASYIKFILESISKGELTLRDRDRAHKGREEMDSRLQSVCVFYTCAVDSENVRKVFDSCSTFIINKHLKRSGMPSVV